MSSNLPQVRSADQDAGSAILQLVCFELYGGAYGVDVLEVKEIIRLPVITKTPNSSAHVEGIINLRGTVVPIISLRRRFGLEECDSGVASRILVTESGGRLVGFVVDAVAEVIRISASEIQPLPSMNHSSDAEGIIRGVVNNRDRLLMILDLKGLQPDLDGEIGAEPEAPESSELA